MTERSDGSKWPEVWAEAQYLPEKTAEKPDGDWILYVPASRLEASERERRELHEALRGCCVVRCYDRTLRMSYWGCRVCGGQGEGLKELHAPDCLAREQRSTEREGADAHFVEKPARQGTVE